MAVSRRYYLNALFDLQLGGFSTGSVERAAAEMTALFVPLLQKDDFALVDVELPEEYIEHLRSFGLAAGEAVTTAPAAGTPMVWGWNGAVLGRLENIRADEHPPLDAVRAVNGRAFCSSVGGCFGLGVPGSGFCTTVDEVEAVVRANDTVFPIVIKPAFGGSGFGLRVLPTLQQMDRERPFIAALCLHGGVVVEPWLVRQCDLSSSMDIGRNGVCGPVTFLRPQVNTYGAFFGIYCADDDAILEPWKKQLEHSTLIMAAEAAKTGYFGPVGCDSFVYRTVDGQDRLAAAIEINARFTMGMLARNLRARIASASPVLLRFIGKKRCTLPETFDVWKVLCGECAYNPVAKKGILLLTPLRNGFRGKWVQPQRSAFLIVGSSEDEIAEYDRELCIRFPK